MSKSLSEIMAIITSAFNTNAMPSMPFSNPIEDPSIFGFDLTNTFKRVYNALPSTESIEKTAASFITNFNFTGDLKKLEGKLNACFTGELAGKGTQIIAAAQNNHINPVLFAAILAHESGHGENCSGHNPGGLMDPATNCMTKQQFDTIEEGLDKVAKNLYKNYINKGLTTIAAIWSKYCPVGANNDAGHNKDWGSGVNYYAQRFSV